VWSAGSSAGERQPLDSHKDADLGLRPEAAPVARSADSSLSYGLEWHLCAWCGIDLDVRTTSPERDGIVSHGMCQPCYERVGCGGGA